MRAVPHRSGPQEPCRQAFSLRVHAKWGSINRTCRARSVAAHPRSLPEPAKLTPLATARQPSADVTTTGHAAQPRPLDRRQLLQLGLALSLACTRPAPADAEEVATASAPAAPAAAPAAPSGLLPVPWLEEDFQVYPPAAFNFVETQPKDDPTRRGPAPERSPVRVRFDSTDGTSAVSVVIRKASSLKQSILQIKDMSDFGTLEEAAALILPQGATLLAAGSMQVALPPKSTPFGQTEVPPKNYYRYEFTTPNGLHVFMSVAAQRGQLYVCGASTAQTMWERYSPDLIASAQSFRLRFGKVVL